MGPKARPMTGPIKDPWQSFWWDPQQDLIKGIKSNKNKNARRPIEAYIAGNMKEITAYRRREYSLTACKIQNGR